jgi:hypothetical protein
MAGKFRAVELDSKMLNLWDSLTSGSSQSTVFASPRFSKAVEKATGRPYTFLVCYRGERVVAGLAIYETRRAGLRVAGQPPLVPHLGLILPAELDEEHPRGREFDVMEASKELAGWLARRFDCASISHHPGLADVRPFVWQDFRARVLYTYRVELGGFGTETVHRSIRKQIAKAEREGVRIEPSEDPTDLLRLVQMSFKKREMAVPYSTRYLEVLFAELREEGIARLYYARDSRGRAISGRVVLTSDDVVYDWVAGADPDYYETGATPFLVYSLMERSREGYRIFDLMGANTRSIAVFKSNFGGAITPYHLTDKAFTLKGKTALFLVGLKRRRRRS